MPLHYCKGSLPQDGYGYAIDICYEVEDGTFWVGNGEYGSCVGFCPYCGTKANTMPSVEIEDLSDRERYPNVVGDREEFAMEAKRLAALFESLGYLVKLEKVE